MKISSKRVRQTFQPVFWSLCRWASVTSTRLLLCVPAATAVRVVRRGADTGVAAPLRGVRPSLLRLLSGPGPLLCLGWGELLRLHPVHQEVRDIERPRSVMFVSRRGVRLTLIPLWQQEEQEAGCQTRRPAEAVQRLQCQR